MPIASSEQPNTAPDTPMAYYSVSMLERDGDIGSQTERARDASHAMAIVDSQIAGTGGLVVGAEFCRLDLRNHPSGSRCKSYKGTVLVDGSCDVHVVNPNRTMVLLKPRLDLANHSPDGFAWGYEGSGPAQLSLALLADALGDDDQALSLYEAFKTRHIATLPINEAWSISINWLLLDVERLAREVSAGLAA